MPARLFTALDREWDTRYAPRRVASISNRWSHHERFSGFARIGDIIDTLRRSHDDPEAADQILAVLAGHAPHDETAARIVLQAVLPGLFNVAKRLGHGHVDDDLESEVLAEAVTRIRTYPIERRPRTIAANITWDVFGRIYRQRQHATRLRVEPTDTIPIETHDDRVDPSVEVRRLIADATGRGRLSDSDAQLLLAVAIGRDTLRDRAEREGVAYAAMNARWRRARSRLRLAVAA